MSPLTALSCRSSLARGEVEMDPEAARAGGTPMAMVYLVSTTVKSQLSTGNYRNC